MKKLILLLLYLSSFISAQVHDRVSFFPLHNGDFWQYKVHTEGNFLDGDTTYYVDVQIVSDTIMSNGKKYYKFLPNTYKNYKRIDSTTANIYYYDFFSQSERIVDTLAAMPGDHYEKEYIGNGYYHALIVDCISIENQTIFNSQREVITFFVPIIDRFQRYYYAEGLGWFGSKKNVVEIIGYESITELVYAKINGVEYGTYVSVEDEKKELPTEYSLSQNYPNPFNPSTTIEYFIPTSPINPSPYEGEGHRERLVTLKVYDILGCEVTTLVNEYQLPGKYSVQFNVKTLHGVSLPNGVSARGGYASGVYFYTLRVGNSYPDKSGSELQTKKMLLIK